MPAALGSTILFDSLLVLCHDLKVAIEPSEKTRFLTRKPGIYQRKETGFLESR